MVKANLYLWETGVMSDEVTVHIFERRKETAGLVIEIVRMILQQKV